jgi:hypothetical protein
MVAFAGAAGWFAHSLTPWAVPALNSERGHRPLEYVLAIPPKLRMWHPLERTGRNWESKRLAKIALYLGDRISVIKALQLPHVGNVMHICGRPEPSGSGATGGNVTEGSVRRWLERAEVIFRKQGSPLWKRGSGAAHPWTL